VDEDGSRYRTETGGIRPYIAPQRPVATGELEPDGIRSDPGETGGIPPGEPDRIRAGETEAAAIEADRPQSVEAAAGGSESDAVPPGAVEADSSESVEMTPSAIEMDRLQSGAAPAGVIEGDWSESQEAATSDLESDAVQGASNQGDPEGPLVSIIVVTLNQLEHTRLCLESLQRHTPESHEIIFVDNGSTDGTLEWLRNIVRESDDTKVISAGKNLGFAGGNNRGMALASGRHLVLLNNDTIVTEGWLEGMLDVLDEHPDVGLVGPCTNYASGPQVVPDASYRDLSEMEEFAEKWSLEHVGRSEPARRLVGFCLLVRHEVAKAIGGLDERFGDGNCEDDDYCLRAFQAGFRARIAQDVFIHHTDIRAFRCPTWAPYTCRR
jgi:GT2 family glycosyltransferase